MDGDSGDDLNSRESVDLEYKGHVFENKGLEQIQQRKYSDQGLKEKENKPLWSSEDKTSSGEHIDNRIITDYGHGDLYSNSFTPGGDD